MTKELIEKIEDAHRRVRKIGPDAIYETELREVLRAAADALAARQPSVIDRDVAIDAIAGGTITVPGGYGVLHGDDAANIVDAIIGQAAVPDAATELRAERDAALSTVAKVRELHQPAWDSVSAMYPTPLCGCGEEYRECPTVQVLPPSLAINAGGLNPEGMTP